MAYINGTEGSITNPTSSEDALGQPITTANHYSTDIFIDNLRRAKDHGTIQLPRSYKLAISAAAGLCESSRERLQPKSLKISPTKTEVLSEDEAIEKQAYHDVVNEVQEHVEHFSPVITSRVPRPKIVSPALTGSKAQQVLGVNAAE